MVFLQAVMGMHTRSGPAPALVDRQRERQALDSLLGDLRSGRGWALVVRGEAGAVSYTHLTLPTILLV